MRFSIIACAVCAAFFAGCNSEQTDSTGLSDNTGSKKLDGEYTVISMRHQGGETSPSEVEGMKWIIDGREIAGYDPDGSSGKMAFRLGAENSPKTIDITALDGNMKGKTDFGIYTFDDGHLQICLSDSGIKTRPTELQVSDSSWIIEFRKVTR